MAPACLLDSRPQKSYQIRSGRTIQAPLGKDGHAYAVTGYRKASGRLSAMAIRGRIFQILGVGLLLLAGWFLLGGLTDPGGGFEIFLPSFWLKVSAVCAVPGAAALVLGIYWVREARSLSEFDVAMEANNRSPQERP